MIRNKIASVAFAISTLAHGATYYLSPDSGDLSNPGTREEPLPSLQAVRPPTVRSTPEMPWSCYPAIMVLPIFEPRTKDQSRSGRTWELA